MKISKVSCALICAGLLSASVAHPSVVAVSTIEIDNLALTFFDADDANANILIPGDDVLLDDISISFTGTSVSTNLNGVAEGDYFTDIINPFDPLLIDLISLQTSGTSLAFGGASLDGNLLLPGGANGATTASVEAYDNSSADSGSQIINNLETIFSFEIDSDVFVDLSFDWMFDAYVAVFDEGGTGVATWDFTISLKDDCIGFSCAGALVEFDLSTLFNGAAQTGTLTDVGDIFDEEAQDSFSSGKVLLAEGVYTLNISQNTSSAAVSVPAPTSLALLGFGLLWVAEISRKKLNRFST